MQQPGPPHSKNGTLGNPLNEVNPDEFLILGLNYLVGGMIAQIAMKKEGCLKVRGGIP
jgi:hypothetical protein